MARRHLRKADQTVKNCLRKVLGHAKVELQQFITLVSAVESQINDRPLASMKSDSNDLAIITPSKLLLGRRLRNLPTPAKEETADSKGDIVRLWKHRNSLAQQAWNRFRKDYLSQVLTTLPKWREDKPSLKVGDVVLVSTEMTTRGSWPLAIVTEINEGRETRSGIVRTVTVEI